MDALYSAYLKLLKALGIDADGSALKALLELNKKLDSIHRQLEPISDIYTIPEGALVAMSDKDIGPTNSEVSLDIIQEYKSIIYDDYLNAFAEDTDASDVSNIINDTPQDRYDRESIELLEPNLRVLLRALEKDDWFGYDYPSQAVMALFEEETYKLYEVSQARKAL